MVGSIINNFWVSKLQDQFSLFHQADKEVISFSILQEALTDADAESAVEVLTTDAGAWEATCATPLQDFSKPHSCRLR